jgi:hypothetical protein
LILTSIRRSIERLNGLAQILPPLVEFLQVFAADPSGRLHGGIAFQGRSNVDDLHEFMPSRLPHERAVVSRMDDKPFAVQLANGFTYRRMAHADLPRQGSRRKSRTGRQRPVDQPAANMLVCLFALRLLFYGCHVSTPSEMGLFLLQKCIFLLSVSIHATESMSSNIQSPTGPFAVFAYEGPHRLPVCFGGKVGGDYVFGTSKTILPGMLLANYNHMLDVYHEFCRKGTNSGTRP